MRLKQAINEKISMCDRIILALSSQELGRYTPSDEVADMVDYMRDERDRLRTEAKELGAGTHWVFGEAV